MGAVIAPLILGAGASAGTIAATALGINIAAYAGTTALSLYLQQQMASEQKQKTGTKLSASFGGAVNQSFNLGRKETAGSLLYINTYGLNGRTPNAFLVKVYCLADRPVQGFANYVVSGGRKCEYNPADTDIIRGNNVGHPIEAFDNNGGHRLWVKFLSGSQTVADAYLRDVFGDDARFPWVSGMIGRGRALMIVTQKYDRKEPAGEIDVVAVVDNTKLYDWREDDTEGGDGDQRFGDYDSYGWDPGNPVVAILNIMAGIRYQDEWMFGGSDWPIRRFDLDSFTAAANYCDDDVALAGGGTEKRYRVGCEIDCSEKPWTIIERMLKSCNGRLIESGGVFKISCGGIGASVLSITDDDVIISEDLTRRPFPGRDEIFNTVIGTYVEPDNGGETKPYKPRTNLAYVASDGEIRQMAMDFEDVRSNTRAQRLSNLALNDNRRFGRFNIALWTKARILEPVDAISWTSERFSLVNEKFGVGEPVLRNDGVVIVPLRDADTSDPDWSTDDEDAYDIATDGDVDAPVQVLPVTVTAIAIKDGAGNNKRPALKLAWDITEEAQVDVKRMAWEARLLDGVELVANGTVDFETGKAIISEGVLKNEAYQVRAKLIPESDRATDWTEWDDTTVYPGALDYILAGNYSDAVDDDAPAALLAPVTTLRTRRHRDGKIRQRLVINLNGSEPARPATESYRVRVFDVDDNDTENFKTEEFPFTVEVQTGHTYTVRILPVSRFGVVGPLSSVSTFSGFSMPIPRKNPLTSGEGDIPTAGMAISWNPGHRRNKIDIDIPSATDFPDFAEAEIWGGTSKVRASATLRKRTKADGWDHTNLNNAEKWYYWYRLKDTSDNVTALFPAGNYVSDSVATSTLVVTDAELGVQADVDPIITGNIVVNQIEIHSAFSADDSIVSYTTVNSDRSDTVGLGNSGPINNPNPSAVILHIKGTVTAGTNSGTARGGQATRTTRINVYSRRSDGTGPEVRVFTEAAVASATYNDAKDEPRSDSQSKSVNVFIVDTYADQANRRYRVEAFHNLDLDAQAAQVTSGGSVVEVSIRLVWWRR